METIVKLIFTPIPAEPMFTILINGKKLVVPKEGVYEFTEEIGNILLKAAPHLFTVQGEEEKADEPDTEQPAAPKEETPEEKPTMEQQQPAPPAKEAPKITEPKAKRAYKRKGGK